MKDNRYAATRDRRLKLAVLLSNGYSREDAMAELYPEELPLERETILAKWHNYQVFPFGDRDMPQFHLD